MINLNTGVNMTDAPAISQFDAKTHSGAVRKLKDGYGFIAGDDGIDYFFHWTAMDPKAKNFRDLVVQERVAFDRIEVNRAGEKKFRAIKIHTV